MADIFISYTSADRDWAFWLGKELEAIGHAPHIHEWEIGAGDDIYSWMERRHDAADHVLCVISDDYLKAPYSTLERSAALWQAASKRPGFVLFVVAKPCKLPTLADHLRRCELFGLSDAVARDQFRSFMAAPASKATSYFPGQAFAVSNIPINVPLHFMGRDEPLAAIAAALARYEGRVAITALHGLRGVGKTTLAAAYAERHRADYRATWWIRAQTEATMRADMVALGVRLGWVEPDAKEEPALATVAERLRHEGEGILLIYDNAIDAAGLKPNLPRGGGARVLVTSNAHNWRGLAEPVEIRLWPTAVGADFLIARTGRAAERAAAEALSDSLGGLPLAHEQAAAYCERLDVGLAEYERRFAAAPTKFLDDARHAPQEHNDGLTVAKSFALAIEEAAKLHPAAEPLIVHAALLAPESIPLFLFSEGREHLGQPLANLLADDGLEEAVAALRTFALVEREAFADERNPNIKTDTIRLHRLVRKVAGDVDPHVADKIRLSLILCINAAFCSDNIYDTKKWFRLRRLDCTIDDLVIDEISLPRNSTTRELTNKVAAYRMHALLNVAGAHFMLKRCLSIAETELGADNMIVAHILGGIADLAMRQGSHDEALLLLKRALSIVDAETRRDDDEHKLMIQSDIAMAFKNKGYLSDAKSTFKSVFDVYEKGLHQHWPGSINLEHFHRLGDLLQLEGNFEGAYALFERSLDICESAYSPDYIRLANCLSKVASVMYVQGRLTDARSMCERAYAACNQLEEPEHAHSATAIANLGEIFHQVGELDKAYLSLQRAAAICRTINGQKHALNADILRKLAALKMDQKEYDASNALFLRALEISEKVYGPDHIETAFCLMNFARLSIRIGAVEDAHLRLERSIKIHRSVLGSKNIRTLKCQSLNASAMLRLGLIAESCKQAESALNGHAAELGPEHPWTKDSAVVVSASFEAFGAAEKAAEVRAQYRV